MDQALSVDFPALTNDVLANSLVFWKSLPFHYLFIGHALFCTVGGQEFKNRWLVHLLLTFLWGNGGGLITSFLLMDPKRAPLSFFQADFIPVAWIICWWLVNHAPGGYVAKLMNIGAFKALCKSCTMLLRAQLIIARVDLGVMLYPDVATAPLLLGTLAGCGGRLLADGIMTGWQSMPGLAELTSPGFVSKSAAVAAVVYYTLAYVAQLLPVQAAAGFVVTGLMLHSVAQDLTGFPLDFTAGVTQLMHTLTCVPVPPAQPKPEPVVVHSKSSTSKQQTPKKQQPNSSPSKNKTPAKSPAAKTTAKSPASKARAEAAAAAAAASPPPPPTTARKRRGAAAAASEAAADADVGTENGTAAAAAAAQLRRGQAVPAAADGGEDTAGFIGVQTRRSQRRAAAAYA